MNHDGTHTDSKPLVAEYRPNKLIRILGIFVASLFSLIWFSMIAGGVWFVSQGEVPWFNFVITSIPMTLVAGFFTYFALAVQLYRLRVFEDRLELQSLTKRMNWRFVDLLDVRLETKAQRNFQGQTVIRKFLYVMPKGPGLKATQIEAFLGSEQEAFSAAVNRWRKALSQ